MTDASARLPLLSVALVSCGALAIELLLTRLFAIVHWHHFAYMMISLALLGFAASGTFLALARRRLIARFAQLYVANLLLFGVLALVSPALAESVPLRAERFLWDPWQPLWLVLVYVLLAVPFFCAANAIGLALIVHRQQVGRIYGADLVGAGVGALGALAALEWLAPEDALRLIAAAGFCAAAAATLELRLPRRGPCAACLLGIALAVVVPDGWLRPEPGPYKSLAQTLHIDGARILHERSNALERVDIVESARVPLRLASGRSLNATVEPPAQLALFRDGDAMEPITAGDADAARLAFLGETTSALPYVVGTVRSVLVLGAGGGVEVLRARHLGATQIDAIELNGDVADLMTHDLRDFSGDLFGTPAVNLRVGDARGLLAGTDAQYDLIQLSLLGPAGARGGLGGLTEDYLHTAEAVRLYLRRLAPGGHLAITRWVDVPPREGLKTVATVVAALDATGVEDVGDRLLMIRGWQTMTLLVKNGRVTAPEIAALREFCARYSFDVVWHPGLVRSDANTYNMLREPWYYDGARALLGPERRGFIASYGFDIRPATDDRPYFGNFFRWSALAEAWRARDRGGMAFLEAGYLLLVATVVQALIIGVVLILVPLRTLRSKAVSARTSLVAVVTYFTCIGFAFLFVEIVFLQQALRSGFPPTQGLALVLAVFLVGAGIGSVWAGRGKAGGERGRLLAAIAGVVVIGLLSTPALHAIMTRFAAGPLAAKAAVTALLIAPLAFCMGCPFPLVIRRLDESLVPWAWGINGCASVISPALATLLAVDLGFRAVLWAALGLYLLAGFASRRLTGPG
jgi:SAM-dependent methyltransferase